MRLRALARTVLERAGIQRSHQSWVPVNWQRYELAVRETRRLAAGDEFFFVQIGANDGVSFDDLYAWVTKHHLCGIVIEPVEDYYAELAANYRSEPQVKPVRTAIHTTNGEVQIHRVAPDSSGNRGIASLDPDHHKKSGEQADIVPETVPAMTWATLLDREQVSRIDYLQIDTEGFDAEILKMVAAEFPRCKPAVIKFEHLVSEHVMSFEQLSDTVAMLTAAGYLVSVGPHEAIAYVAVVHEIPQRW